MTKVVFFINNKSQEKVFNRYAMTFFVNRKNDPFITERIKEFLANLIEQYCSNPTLMSIAFDVISELFQDQLADFIAIFLDRNKNFEDFRNIRIEAFDPVVWGNQIPEHEKRIAHLESILPLTNSLELLQHKQWIEKRIILWRKQIEQINREAFVGDDW
jgi:hypothetical protein